MVHLEITEYFKNRRIPFPTRVELTERQSMQFLDNKYLMSPYKVESQSISFLLEGKDVVEATNEKKRFFETTEHYYKYGPYRDIEPLQFEPV
mmetsp:Transcript_32690/g.23625  ORF Transcript_32690/g.23625 Transcript_32690/m.23625 type:complete len:92 (-) Transcript_32690:872-1147(-)